ncbi:MAG: hypothetical protein ACP5E5_10790 [Acidobacteriaceae bacterium]
MDDTALMAWTVLLCFAERYVPSWEFVENLLIFHAKLPIKRQAEASFGDPENHFGTGWAGEKG